MDEFFIGDLFLKHDVREGFFLSIENILRAQGRFTHQMSSNADH